MEMPIPKFQEVNTKVRENRRRRVAFCCDCLRKPAHGETGESVSPVAIKAADRRTALAEKNQKILDCAESSLYHDCFHNGAGLEHLPE
jgi:hypothetical protein